MIGTIDIKVNAAHPNMPLTPVYAHIGSPSQVRIINVPKAIGKWAVTAVQITANYPDNTSRSVSCTLVGGCWSATLPASTAVGQSLMGFKVTASGTDETGAAVTGYVLGKGDVFILNDDSTITIGSTTYYVHLLDAQPTYPKKGDLCLIGGAWKIYNGTEWIAFGGGTGDVRHAEFSDMTADLDPDESSMGDVMTKVNTLITKLRGTSAALVALLALGSFAAVEVQTAALKSLPGKTMIVTNITGAVDQTITNGLCSVAAAQAMTNDANIVRQNTSITGTITFDNGRYSYPLVVGHNMISLGDIEITPYVISGGSQTYIKPYAWEMLVASYGGQSYEVQDQTLPDFLASTAWHGSNKSLTDYGITNSMPTAASLSAVTYASGDPTTAAEILSSAENTAGTISTNVFDISFNENADYALTNLTAGALSLRSGEIGNYTTAGAAFTLALDFSAAAGRSGDCLLYVANTGAADARITLTPNTYTYVATDIAKARTLTAATTNIVSFTRVKADTILVSKIEVK